MNAKKSDNPDMGFFERTQSMVACTIIIDASACCSIDYHCTKLFNKPFHILIILMTGGFMNFIKEQELPLYLIAQNLGFLIAYILFFTILYFIVLRNFISSMFHQSPINNYQYYIIIMIMLLIIYRIIKKYFMKDKEQFGRVTE